MKIKEIFENEILIELDDIAKYQHLINSYVIFRDDHVIVGEIFKIKDNTLSVRLIGEFINQQFVFGINNKPGMNALLSIADSNVINLITSYNNDINGLYLGKCKNLNNTNIFMNLNKFASSHFSIIGGTGSGKSCALSRIIQNMFLKNPIPYNANLFVFDTYGEYYPSFTSLESINPNISFKSYSTNINEESNLLKIPPYLLDVDDLAILLNATDQNQLRVLEKALDLVRIFKSSTNEIITLKNDIIARAVVDILLSGRPSVQIRDQVFSILSFYNTEDLNLDTEIFQPGYTRNLKNCLVVDNNGKIQEMELLTKFFSNFFVDNINIKKDELIPYTLEDLEMAIDFALINEGVFKSEKIYDNNNLLKVRIHNLVDGPYKKYFEYQTLVNKNEYISSLIMKNGKKSQLINFNINYVDDRFGKNIVKILSKMIFDVAKVITPRGSSSFHLILEEAHRYVQNDGDVNLLGYNIFERIAKEGRKYGVLLGLITQRPSELSETVISQCNNFLIFKLTHPLDVDYISKMIPYLDNEYIKKIKVLQPGDCYTFGTAFKLSLIVTLDYPNPSPISDNIDISRVWYNKNS